MKKEVKFRLVKHIAFLENEIKDYESFRSLNWDEYDKDRNKRRNVERWVENIINSSIDIVKIILTSEELQLPDTYKDMVKNLSIVKGFNKDTEILSKWVGLRNIISHEYLDMRWSSIKRFISETEPLYRDFLDRIKAYIKKKTDGDEE